MKLTKITVKKGALLINYAFVYKKAKDICLIVVDMKSKRGDVCFTGSDNSYPDMYVGAGHGSLYLNPKCKKDRMTQIIFKDFKGWNIMASNICKYSIYVCLIKESR